MFKVNNKESVSIVNFEQVNANWAGIIYAEDQKCTLQKVLAHCFSLFHVNGLFLYPLKARVFYIFWGKDRDKWSNSSVMMS